MTDEPAKCQACGRELDDNSPGIEEISASLNPYPDEPKNFVQRSLKRHIELLDELSGQLDDLLETVRQGDAGSQQVLDGLETLRESLKPRHGLCIDPNCAPCRVHEEAIKEHVLIYVDWKVPGTVEKLQQSRHRN